jgi:hypothetical protein
MDKQQSRRGMKVIGIALIVYGLLVATHLGEFWPFSIYPMFSKAGQPWTRAMVMDVTGLEESEIWERTRLENRVAEPVSVRAQGVDQIDFSNFVSKTENWTETRKEALQEMFGKENIGSDSWMVSKVQGRLVGEDSVVVNVQPFLLLTSDTVRTNPLLERSDYFRTEGE